jgi:LCP family protein required for cell wall assembly
VRALKYAAVAVSLAVFLGTAGAYAVLRHEFGGITKVPLFGSSHKTTAEHAAVNFLLVGSDARQNLSKAQQKLFHLGHDQGRRSDTMILLHISPHHQKAILVSFPRDSWVQIPAYRGTNGKACGKHTSDCHPMQFAKLNAAFSYGGPRLTIRTIERATHIPINHYVEINVLGLANIVNALGGVNVCVSHNIDDRHFNGTDEGSGLVLSAGHHHIFGVQAVQFARTRHDLPDQDLGRIKRQQALLGALFHEALKAGTLLNPAKLNAFVNATKHAIRLDNQFTTKDIFTLAGAMGHLDPKHVSFLTVPISNSNYRPPQDPAQDAVEWDPTLSTKLFQRIIHDRAVNPPHKRKLTVAPSSISLHVLNGTTTNGLAHKAANDLAGIGFHILGQPADAQTKGLAQTEVHYGSSRADSARTLAAAIPGAKLVADSSLGAGDVTVILGANYNGVHSVHLSSGGTGKQFQTTTAADHPCT